MFFVTVVPQNHCAIVMRFGRPVKKWWRAGVHVRIPLLESIHNVKSFNGWTETHKEGIFIELTDQVSDTGRRPYVTKDNVNTSVNALIRWKVVDPIKAVFDVDHLHKSLVESVLNELRARIGTMTLDEVTSARTALSQDVQKAVFTTTNRWGVVVTSVEIQDITFDDATKEAMLAQMAAERKRRAAILEAEGKADALKMLAEAQKTAQAIHAEADMQYLARVSEAVGRDNAARLLQNRQTMECYGQISQNAANKVFLPASMNISATEESKAE